jgi:hypothetical protein
MKKKKSPSFLPTGKMKKMNPLVISWTFHLETQNSMGNREVIVNPQSREQKVQK